MSYKWFIYLFFKTIRTFSLFQVQQGNVTDAN